MFRYCIFAVSSAWEMQRRSARCTCAPQRLSSPSGLHVPGVAAASAGHCFKYWQRKVSFFASKVALDWIQKAEENRVFRLCNKLKVYNFARLEMESKPSLHQDIKVIALAGFLSKWAVVSNSSFHNFSIQTLVSVIFSSFYHQCPVALYVCSVSESLGVSADKKETNEFPPAPPSFFLPRFLFHPCFLKVWWATGESIDLIWIWKSKKKY